MKYKQTKYGWMFLGISVVGVLFFYILPLLYGGMKTFQSGIGFSWKKGIGVYEDVLHSQTFWLAMRNTGMFMLCCIPLLLIFAIILTYYMEYDNSVRNRKAIWIAAWLVPYIIPSNVVVQVCRWLFGDNGVFGFTGIAFLKSSWTFVLLCVVFLWRNTGYIMVILLSGSSNISREQREAAALDGASRKRTFGSIILPQLISFLRFSVVMGVIGVFRLYRESYLLLGSQPCDEVYMLQNFLNNNFASWNFDRAVVASMILFFVMILFYALIFGRQSSRN